MNKYNYLSHWFFIICFAFFSLNLSAQVNCTATAPSQVNANQPFRYSVTLNEKPSNIANVSFSNFKVLNGPNQSSSHSTSIINGQVSKNTSYTYSYTLLAEKTGNFTINGLSFVVNGKQVKSNAVKIEVIPATAQQQKAQQQQQQANGNFDKNEVFVRAYASKTSPYLGEQVLITHKLYIGPGVNGGYRVTKINAPSQTGLWSIALGDPDGDAPQSYEVINGKRYTVFEVKRVAVFPQKSGELMVSPLEIGFIARVITRTRNSGDIFDQFFGGGQRAQDYELNLKSNVVKLQVKPLPNANKPADFDDVVGNYSIKSSLTQTDLKTNDATNLVITISGTGNLQHIESLPLIFPPDFDVTEPKISDNINTLGTNVNGSRSFEYIIIPRTPGKFNLPSVNFSFFDTKTSTYKTLSTEEYAINVEKGEGDAGVEVSSSNKKDIKFLGKDIRYIKNSKHPFRLVASPFFNSVWYYFFLLLPVFLFILFIVIWRKQIENRSNVAQLRNRKANKVARKRLKKANKLLHDNLKEEFFEEISQVLWGYMSDKFHIPLSQLSMDTVEIKLQEKNLSSETIGEFLDTLHQCEFARFAPGDSSQMMNEMYQHTLDLIFKYEL